MEEEKSLGEVMKEIQESLNTTIEKYKNYLGKMRMQ